MEDLTGRCYSYLSTDLRALVARCRGLRVEVGRMSGQSIMIVRYGAEIRSGNVLATGASSNTATNEQRVMREA